MKSISCEHGQYITNISQLSDGRFAMHITSICMPYMIDTLFILDKDLNKEHEVVIGYDKIHILSDDRILIFERDYIKIWNPNTGIIEHTLQRSKDVIVLPDHTVINDTQIWNPYTGIVEDFLNDDPIQSITLVNDYLLSIKLEDGTLQGYNTNTHKYIFSAQTEGGIAGLLSNNTIVTTNNESIKIWDKDTLIHEIETLLMNKINIIGNKIIGVTISLTPKLMIWDEIGILQNEYPQINSITILPDNKIVAWNRHRNSEIKIISVDTGTMLTFNEHKDYISTVEILPSKFWDNCFVSAAYDGEIYIWNYETGKIKHQLQALDRINEIFILNDGTFITRSHKVPDCTLQFWR